MKELIKKAIPLAVSLALIVSLAGGMLIRNAEAASDKECEVALSHIFKGENTLELTVSVTSNPGFDTARLYLDYPEGFELQEVSAEDCIVSGHNAFLSKNLTYNPYSFGWNGETVSGEGAFAVFTFALPDTLEKGRYEFDLSVCDISFLPAGSMTPNVFDVIVRPDVLVVSDLDFNGDYAIDEEDVAMIRAHINTPAATDTAKFDLNEDGFINETDVELLRAY